MHLWFNTFPRALYLATSPQDEALGAPPRVLVFRTASHAPRQAIVEYLPKHQVNFQSLGKLSTRVIKGCLGLISVDNDIFLALVTSATEVGNTRPSALAPESVAKIHEISFFCVNSATWDDLTVSDTMPGADEAAASSSQVFEHPCAPLTKILSSGSFYYALGTSWDLSSRLSKRLSRSSSSNDLADFDERFVWNEFIVRSLLDFRARLEPREREEFDECHFLILAIQGYVGVFTMSLPAPPTDGAPIVATLSLISRLGWKRAGTRFNTRGVDDDGNTANFVETETVFSTDQHSTSFIQIRGSVPLFWEQQGLQTFGHKIQIHRPNASQPAFERHFSQLTEEYGAVHAINLLGVKENEQILTAAYDRHLQFTQDTMGDHLGITHFDFHAAVRIGGHDSVVRELRYLDSIADNIDRFGFTMCDSSSQEIITDQKGAFRTNCLDCLDRTNFVQDILSRHSLNQYLDLVHREWNNSQALWTYHRELWAENGDALSRIYAGTGALNTSFTRTGKRTLAGVLSDATKSVSRAYINNFQDKGKQNAIDMFLGNMSNQRQVTIFDPVHDSVRFALQRRLPEYSSTQQCVIFAGTWNLNGRVRVFRQIHEAGQGESDPVSRPRRLSRFFHGCSPEMVYYLSFRSDLAASNLNFNNTGLGDPDIFALGFQEIVPLTAQQIVQADPEKRRLWENKILETLDRRPNKKCDYILLRSDQLVGTALVILVKAGLTGVIRNVEGSSRKTGLRGMSGNKGAVAIRFDYHDTPFCFVTAHLAAGHANVEERNADYRTVANGLHFLKGKTLQNHQNVIWLADTNYRIDLENGIVRSLAEADDYDSLLAADQLKRNMDAGFAFSGYDEGPLLFRPTYRYDVGTDTYDTSEKMRVPAWTDRILYKGTPLDLTVYARAELRGSDHRPVYAIFRGSVRIIDYAKREALSKLLLDSVTSTGPDENLDEKLAALTIIPSIAEALPQPSSEDFSWWSTQEHPDGTVPVRAYQPYADSDYEKRNPFDFDDSPLNSPLSSIPSSSDEELYRGAQALQEPIKPTPSPQPATVRRPAPPPPVRPNANMGESFSQ